MKKPKNLKTPELMWSPDVTGFKGHSELSALAAGAGGMYEHRLWFRTNMSPRQGQTGGRSSLTDGLELASRCEIRSCVSFKFPSVSRLLFCCSVTKAASQRRQTGHSDRCDTRELRWRDLSNFSTSGVTEESTREPS